MIFPRTALRLRGRAGVGALVQHDIARVWHRIAPTLTLPRKRERGQAVRYRASRAERHKIYTTKIQRTQRPVEQPPSCTQWNRNQTPSVPAFAAA